MTLFSFLCHRLKRFRYYFKYYVNGVLCLNNIDTISISHVYFIVKLVIRLIIVGSLYQLCRLISDTVLSSISVVSSA